jgi:hypothetical protein
MKLVDEVGVIREEGIEMQEDVVREVEAEVAAIKWPIKWKVQSNKMTLQIKIMERIEINREIISQSTSLIKDGLKILKVNRKLMKILQILNIQQTSPDNPPWITKLPTMTMTQLLERVKIRLKIIMIKINLRKINTIRANTMEMKARVAVVSSMVTIISRIERVADITTMVMMSMMRDTINTKTIVVDNDIVVRTSKDITKVIIRVIKRGDNTIIINKQIINNNMTTDILRDKTKIIKIMIMDTRMYLHNRITSRINHSINQEISHWIKKYIKLILKIISNWSQEMPKTNQGSKWYISQKIVLKNNRPRARQKIRRFLRTLSNINHLKSGLTTTIEGVAKINTIGEGDMIEVAGMIEVDKKAVVMLQRKIRVNEHKKKRIKRKIGINMTIDTIMAMKTLDMTKMIVMITETIIMRITTKQEIMITVEKMIIDIKISNQLINKISIKKKT